MLTEPSRYEEEIARLQRELEARGGPSQNSQHHGPSQPPPPSIGHGPSNLFGGIMAGNNQGGPGLAPPPQEPQQPGGLPPHLGGAPQGPPGLNPAPGPPQHFGGYGSAPSMNGGECCQHVDIRDDERLTDAQATVNHPNLRPRLGASALALVPVDLLVRRLLSKTVRHPTPDRLKYPARLPLHTSSMRSVHQEFLSVRAISWLISIWRRCQRTSRRRRRIGSPSSTPAPGACWTLSWSTTCLTRA